MTPQAERSGGHWRAQQGEAACRASLGPQGCGAPHCGPTTTPAASTNISHLPLEAVSAQLGGGWPCWAEVMHF